MRSRRRQLHRLWPFVVVAILLTCLTASAQSFITVAVGTSSVSWNIAFGNALVPGNANNRGSNPVSVTTTWSLHPGQTQLALYAYFTNAAAALAHTTCTVACMDIPSSAVQIQVNGGAFVSAVNTVPFTGVPSGIQLWSMRILGFNKSGSRTDTLNFNINLNSLSQLPADTYDGVLILQAQATP